MPLSAPACAPVAPEIPVIDRAFAAPPVGVLLFNMGGPATLADVEPFLVNLFSDRDIIELPMGALLQPVVARIIAKARGNGVRRNYASIGGGSPQLRLTRAQAMALNDHLDRQTGRRHVVEVAMRYWQPDTETALQRLASEGVSRLVTLTLHPHFSRATTESSRREFERVVAQPKWRGRFEVDHVEAYPDHPLYRALIDHDYALFAGEQLVEREAAGFPPFAFQAMLRAEARELKHALDFLHGAVSLAPTFPEVLIYDPVPMRLARLKNRERAQLLVESRSRPGLQAFLAAWMAALQALKMPHDLRWHLDVDPLEF